MSDASAQESDRPAKARVFISYSRKDIDFADRLDIALKARGFEPLLRRIDRVCAGATRHTGRRCPPREETWRASRRRIPWSASSCSCLKGCLAFV